jgi:AcrR family transcriptional regulator
MAGADDKGIESPALGRRHSPRQARGVATQERLLRAAVDALIDFGYARLTTAAIAARAQMSEGALFRHYPTKADLIVAAVERIFADLQAEHARLMRRTPPPGQRIGAAVRALAKVMMSPAYLATNEVYLASRTDPALQAAIRPMARRHQQELLQRARTVVGATAASDFDAAFDSLVLSLQGTAVDSVALGDTTLDRRRLAFLVRIAPLLLDPSRAGSALPHPIDPSSDRSKT